MMFALSIIDKLTPGFLSGGKIIAGTGTIDSDGQVGAIGGIVQKISASSSHGAKLFLAPRENCSDLVGHIPENLVVTPVSTLTEAVTALTDFKNGKKLPSCPAAN